ncbi:O-antigen polymerase family protein OS=Planctomyces maris DSM 8797 GN=PM8797T_27482 PE=4 SV=1: O-antigen_lig [Gemmata massiliana]|uniref:Uncharacterized protein n=1 Tax=Gemmata massiliana TaxID=1210884 RepID=A0A6P2D8A0_9BACT|nr:hypothetical protein [Gemmata massiliana]VTR95700.1 O-antigen polymerase family protein OS=Planctomyces maris DSM 8797 GN=PM8797T_27482 PE=4 SV=1: O-antigen_lig [Gemmata massiliana]
MNFVLFLLLNAVLLLRPEELFPEIAGLRLYLLTIIPCVLLSLPQLAHELSPGTLRRRPISVCVLLFFFSTILSFFVQGRLGEALFEFGPEFGKVILYYFLLLATVDTPNRFRTFVAALVALIGGLTTIALAQHYEIVHFSNIVPCLQKGMDPVTGEATELPRLVSSGIFNDPNDLCLMLGLGIMSCIYCATSRPQVIGGFLWLLPIPLFIYALMDTHSKGGLLGVLAGGSAYLYSRFGGPKALPYAAAGAVVAVLAIGGRQASIGGGGTAHERLMFWADGLSNLFSQPFYIPTGLGIGWFVSENGLVAHNSFVQAYVELGLLGGGAFLASFYLSARILDRFGRGVNAPHWVLDAKNYGFGVLIGYAMGCYSLTRNFTVTTYLVLGISSVLLAQASHTLPNRFQVNRQWFNWLFFMSAVGLAALKLMTQAISLAGV